MLYNWAVDSTALRATLYCMVSLEDNSANTNGNDTVLVFLEQTCQFLFNVVVQYHKLRSIKHY